MESELSLSLPSQSPPDSNRERVAIISPVGLFLASSSQIPTSPSAEFIKSMPLSLYIVDDNKINVLLLNKMLQSIFRCDVYSCGSGQELIEKLSLRPTLGYAVVLTDIYMPEMSGIELTLLLRKTTDKYALPILGVTADHTTQLHEECLESGMQCMITKPVSCSQLLLTIASVMQRTWPVIKPELYFCKNTSTKAQSSCACGKSE